MTMKEGAITTEHTKSEFEFKDIATAQEYLEWKKVIPDKVRRLVEAAMNGHESLPSQTGLVLSDQFLNALGKSLTQNNLIDLSGIDDKVSNLLAPLARIETKGGYLNVFETLRNPEASFNFKQKNY